MKKLALFGMVLVLSLTLSCARKVNNFETGMRMSNNIYNDLAPQITDALRSAHEDSARADYLQLTNQKLDEYRKAYGECMKAVDIWRSTGQTPENMMELYKEMWRSLLEARSLAASVYIYTSECVASTTLKGKACKN